MSTKSLDVRKSVSGRRRLVAAAAGLCAIPLLAGCFNGFGATTTMQATQNSGNGVDAQVGAMKIQNATLVRGEGGAATLMMTLVNVGERDDTLTSVTIGGAPAVVTDGSTSIATVTVPRQRSVPFGYGQDGAGASRWVNSYSFGEGTSGYVPVTVFFTNAGQAQLSVLTVPAVGYYEGIAPTPAVAPSPSASTSPSPSPSA